MDKTVDDGIKNGYVTTLFGRRRYIPELSASNKVLQAFGKRAAMNAPIQGAAADIIKIAMVRVYKMLREEDLDARLILQVHDELIIEASEKDKDFIEKSFLPNVLELAKVDNKQVGLPFSISAPIVYYNPDLFTAAGLDPQNPPKTWEEVRAASKAIHDKTGAYGFYMQEYQDNWATQGLLTSNGAKILDDKNKAVFASKESADAYQLYADMVLKDQSALHIAADEGIASFYSGKVGILMGTSAKIGTVTQSSKFNVMACPFPAFGDKKVQIPAGGNFLAVTAQSKEEQQAAWEFMKFIMQPKYLAQWTINTGYLPPRQEVVEDPAIKEAIAKTPALKVAFDELPTLSPWVAFPGDVGVKAEKMFADTRDKILSGEEPMAALKKAQDDLNALLK